MRAKTKGIVGASIGAGICLIMAIAMCSQGMPIVNGVLFTFDGIIIISYE